jgi:hypothetical protein
MCIGISIDLYIYMCVCVCAWIVDETISSSVSHAEMCPVIVNVSERRHCRVISQYRLTGKGRAFTCLLTSVDGLTEAELGHDDVFCCVREKVDRLTYLYLALATVQNIIVQASVTLTARTVLLPTANETEHEVC